MSESESERIATRCSTCGRQCCKCVSGSHMKVGKIEFHENNLPGVFQPFPNPEPMMMVPVSAMIEKSSLRDQMAMAALTGMLAREQMDTNLASMLAYQVADAMMRAR